MKKASVSKSVRKEESPAKPVVRTIGFILVAISMLVSGIIYICGFMNDGKITWDDGGFMALANMMAYLVVGICLILVAAYGFVKKSYAESMFFAIFAVFMLIVYATCKFSGEEVGDSAMMMIDVLLGLLLIIPVVAFALKGEFLLVIGGAFYIVANLAAEVFPHAADQLVYGLFSLIAGLIFVYLAFAYLIEAETGRKLPIF